jgi:hypothetical protein
MADHDQADLDPVLADAYRADQAVVASVTGSLGDLREQILTAALKAATSTTADPPPASATPLAATSRLRTFGALAAVAVIAATLGYAIGRRDGAASGSRSIDARTGPALPAGAPPSAPTTAAGDSPPATTSTSPIDAALIDPAPTDADPGDAGPAIDTGPRSDGPAIRNPEAPAAPRRRSRPAAIGTEMNEPLLIDQARAALRRRLVDEAAVALERHQREFADGQLVEEREALLIEVDILKGRVDDASARIERYRQRFPSGLLRDYVESLAPARPAPP